MDRFLDDYKNLIFDDPVMDPKMVLGSRVALGIRQRGGYHRKERHKL